MTSQWKSSTSVVDQFDKWHKGGLQGPRSVVLYIYKDKTNQTMKLTYAQQIKADRRAAALERRQDDYRQDAGRVAVYKHVKTEVKTRQAAILRRLAGRLANLKALGRGYNDAHLFLLQALAANFTNDELLAKFQGQTAMIWALDRQIVEGLGLEWTIVKEMQDDEETDKNTPFGALFVDADDVEFVKEFVNQLVVDYKANH